MVVAPVAHAAEVYRVAEGKTAHVRRVFWGGIISGALSDLTGKRVGKEECLWR